MNPTIIFLLYSLYLTNKDDDNKFFCQGIVMVIKQCVKACTFYFEVNAWRSDLKFYDDTQQKFSYCLSFLSAYLNLFTNFLTNALSKIQNLRTRISWHMSDMWLSYPTLFLVLRNVQCIKCIKGNVFLVRLHC